MLTKNWIKYCDVDFSLIKEGQWNIVTFVIKNRVNFLMRMRMRIRMRMKMKMRMRMRMSFVFLICHSHLHCHPHW